MREKEKGEPKISLNIKAITNLNRHEIKI